MALGLGYGVLGDAQKDTLDIYQFEHIIIFIFIFYIQFLYPIFYLLFSYYKKIPVKNDYQTASAWLTKVDPKSHSGT